MDNNEWHEPTDLWRQLGFAGMRLRNYSWQMLAADGTVYVITDVDKALVHGKPRSITVYPYGNTALKPDKYTITVDPAGYMLIQGKEDDDYWLLSVVKDK